MQLLRLISIAFAILCLLVILVFCPQSPNIHYDVNGLDKATGTPLTSNILNDTISQAPFDASAVNKFSAPMMLAAYDRNLTAAKQSKLQLNRSKFITDTCNEVDALIESEELTQGQAKLTPASAMLNEAQELFGYAELTQGAAKLIDVMDVFPRTEASKVANRAASALQELAQTGQLTEVEIEDFMSRLPAWKECSSAEGKYILLDMARTRADAAKALGQKDAAKTFHAETQTQAWQLLNEHPESPIQIDVPVLYYESSSKLGPEETREAAGNLAEFIEGNANSVAGWASRSVLAMHLQRMAHDVGSARMQQLEFLNQADKSFVRDVLEDPYVYDWVKAMIEYESLMSGAGLKPYSNLRASKVNTPIAVGLQCFPHRCMHS